MLKLIGQILLWLRGGTLKLLILMGIILLVWGTLAPVGTLVWWVNEAKSLGLTKRRSKKLPPPNPTNPITQSPNINCYIVFLPGVGDFSANQLTPGEELFLNRLVKLHPNCVVVSGVFPYSAANESLGGRRFLAPLWNFANQADGWLENADILIKIRNLWRFAISIDTRYGPVYNQGIANAIINRMNAENPIPQDSHQPLKIILIGTSGGAQVALGAAPYLKQWLEIDTQIIMVSVGGVFGGQDGYEAIDHIYHLQGRQDWIEDIGTILFPSRWPWTVGSPFNQAQRQGKFTARVIGPQGHDGPTGYFGQKLVKPKISYVDLTMQSVNKLPIWAEKSKD